MTILITGVAGFIGTNLANNLLQKGNRVVGVDNFITGQEKNIEFLKTHKDFLFVKGDIRDVSIWKTMRQKVEKCQEIYHLACPTGVPNCKTLGIEMLTTSVIGTRYVLEFAVIRKSHVVFTSSSESYGDPKVFPQTETYGGNVNPIGFRSPYEEGKRCAESLIVNFAQEKNIHAVIARIFNTYGPHANPKDMRVIPQFIGGAISNVPLAVHNTGNQTRTFCYVDDTVSALQLLMKKGKSGEVYNVGSNIEVSIQELARKIIAATQSKSTMLFQKNTIPDHKRRRPDINKILMLGWKPKVSLEEGLRKTIINIKGYSLQA